MPGPILDNPRIFLGLPTYDGSRYNGVQVTNAVGSVAVIGEVQFSILTNCFNRLWVRMLNLRESQGITHFIMMHADVRPQGDWVGTLYRELVACGGDVLSAIIPIKNHQGLTSTGLDEGDDWHPRRFALHEIFKLPETFTAPNLVFNTGLWIADVRGDWVEKVCFHIEDKIFRNAEGQWEAAVQPEDWHFSRQVRALGLKAFATRKVALEHHGAASYPNTAPWGTLQTDTRAGHDIRTPDAQAPQAPEAA